jgi:hypothetical protein
VTAAERAALAAVAADLRAAADAADRGDLPAVVESLTDSLVRVIAVAEGAPDPGALDTLHAVPDAPDPADGPHPGDPWAESL